MAEFGHGADSGTALIKRSLMSTCLSEAGMQCVTDCDFTTAGKLSSKSSIDHLCLSKAWADKVTQVDVWLPELIGNQSVSDHNGVYVDLEC